MDLIIKQAPVANKETLNLKPEAAPKPVVYKAEKFEVSDNIKKFDKKAKAVTKNPFDHNTIAVKDRESVPSTPTAFEMITDPTYNTVGKFLGVDTLHEWNKDYNKVFDIVNWAKRRSGAENLEGLVQWINGAVNFVPSLSANHRKIDQLYLYSKIQQK